jgi:hypothetical protein
MRLPVAYHVKVDGNKVATIQQDRESDKWFWYGDGINSLSTTGLSTLDECKAHAKSHFTTKLRESCEAT